MKYAIALFLLIAFILFSGVNAEYTSPPDVTTVNYLVAGGGGGGVVSPASGSQTVGNDTFVDTVPTNTAMDQVIVLFFQIGILAAIAGIIFMLLHSLLPTSNYGDSDYTDPHFRKEAYKDSASIDAEIDRIIAKQYAQRNPSLIKKITGSKEKDTKKQEWVIKKYD
jgi:hypothetical protein